MPRVTARVTRASFPPPPPAPAPAAPRLVTSRFLITNSTNYRPATAALADERMDEYVRVLEDGFSDNAVLETLLRFNAGTFADVESIDSETGGEFGPSRVGGRIHSHTVMTVVHRANLQFDAKKLNEYVEARLPWVKGAYTHIDLMGRDMARVQAYIRKHQRS